MLSVSRIHSYKLIACTVVSRVGKNHDLKKNKKSDFMIDLIFYFFQNMVFFAIFSLYYANI